MTHEETIQSITFRMTLSIIDMRLKVFPQYLEYRINQNIAFKKAVFDKDTFLWTTATFSFNEWLYRNNYSNLIL